MKNKMKKGLLAMVCIAMLAVGFVKLQPKPIQVADDKYPPLSMENVAYEIQPLDDKYPPL